MPSRTPQRLAVAVVGLIAVGSTVVFGSHRPSFGVEPGHMPACGSGTIRQLLKRTLEQPNPDIDHLQVLKLGGIDDVSEAFTPEERQGRPDRRRCVANTYTNVGHQLVVFQIDWIDDRKDDVYLEIPEVPF